MNEVDAMGSVFVVTSRCKEFKYKFFLNMVYV